MTPRTFAAAALGLALALAPVAASVQAATYWVDKYGHRHYYHHTRTCHEEKRANGNVGTVVGGVGGAAVGAGVSHGSVVGTLVGAGAGAVAGHAVGRSTTHC